MLPRDPLTADQQAILDLPADARVWVEGSAGSGKTTAAAARVAMLVQQGIPAQQILILLPQRTLAGPYQQVMDSPEFPTGGRPDILTLNGLAQRSLMLFWPLVAKAAGFASPNSPPVFLTMETAQYYMARVAEPLLRKGYFAAIKLAPNRLYSQLLDNLNKSALVGFPHSEIGSRLASAWTGPSSQMRVYEQAQEVISAFRQECLARNLLDFSLQIEIFNKQLQPALLFQQYVQTRYRYIIADNLEEDTPAAHDMLLNWLPAVDGALLLYDTAAGYRRFLGADPEDARKLKDHCQVLNCDPLPSQPAGLRVFTSAFSAALGLPIDEPIGEIPAPPLPESEVLAAIRPISTRFYPQMLETAAKEVARVIENGTPAAEIAILAPYLTDRLRFSLTELLAAKKVNTRVLRPSRTMQQESAIRCLLVLARVAHPGWQMPPLRADFTAMLSTAIKDLDPIRAGILAEIVQPRRDDAALPGDFASIHLSAKERITFTFGELYSELRDWLINYATEPPLQLEYFFSRIFGELLTRPGFGFFGDQEAGKVTANLIESARKFRQAVQGVLASDEIPQEFISAVDQGLISAQYLRSWEAPQEAAVTLAPAYSFLLQNRPAAVQVWLDVGSNAWYERLEQPLTHPFVLSRQWQQGDVWDDAREAQENRQALLRLVQGLARRCTSQILLMHCEVGEQGYDQSGALIRNSAFAYTRVRRAANQPTEASDV